MPKSYTFRNFDGRPVVRMVAVTKFISDQVHNPIFQVHLLSTMPRRNSFPFRNYCSAQHSARTQRNSTRSARQLTTYSVSFSQSSIIVKKLGFIQLFKLYRFRHQGGPNGQKVSDFPGPVLFPSLLLSYFGKWPKISKKVLAWGPKWHIQKWLVLPYDSRAKMTFLALAQF